MMIYLRIGNRYMFSNKIIPGLYDFGATFAGIDWTTKSPPQSDMEITPPVFNHEFLKELGDDGFCRRSFMKWERI